MTITTIRKKKLGIIRTSSLGDVVLSTSILNLLEELNCELDVVWFGREPMNSLIKISYPHVSTISFNSDDSLKKIYGELSKVDLLLDLQKSFKINLVIIFIRLFTLVKVSSVDKKYFHRMKLLFYSRFRGRKKPLSYEVSHPTFFQYQLVLEAGEPLIFPLISDKNEYYLKKLNARPKLSLPIYNNLLKIIESFSKQTKIALAPGGSFPTKKVPVSVWIEIFKNLITKNPTLANSTQFLLLGDKFDKEIGDIIEKHLSKIGFRIKNLCGILNLAESIKIAGECQLIVGNDSVLGHGAEAQNIDSFVFFGATVEGFGFAPFRPTSQSFSLDLGCRPCSKHGKTPCRYGDLFCFNSLDTSKIANILNKKILAIEEAGQS